LITRTRHIRKLRPSLLFQYCQAPCGTRSSPSPPAGLVSSPPRQKAGRRRPRPGSPWPSPAPGAWGLRRAFVPGSSGAMGHLMRTGVVWLAISSGMLLLLLSPAPCISQKQKTRVRRALPWLPGAGPIPGRTGGYPREACFMAWATRPAISLAPSQSKGLRSTIRKGWWFSTRMILRWTEVNVLLTSSSTMSSLSSVIEDARADGR
jgi:hypothetical protein